MVVLDSLQSGLQSAVANTELTATEQNTLALLYETLIARHDQAVVSMEGHLLREGGAFYDADRHWLTATSGSPKPTIRMKRRSPRPSVPPSRP